MTSLKGPSAVDQTVFVTIHQVADRWQCSEKKVRRLIKQRALPAYLLGGQYRVREVDLLAYERTSLV